VSQSPPKFGGDLRERLEKCKNMKTSEAQGLSTTRSIKRESPRATAARKCTILKHMRETCRNENSSKKEKETQNSETLNSSGLRFAQGRQCHKVTPATSGVTREEGNGITHCSPGHDLWRRGGVHGGGLQRSPAGRRRRGKAPGYKGRERCRLELLDHS